MNSTHDLGGMHGFGEIDQNQTENFVHSWEEKVFGLTLACGLLGEWNLDESRSAREQMNPAEYLQSSYYEHWLHGLETLLLEKNLIKIDELESGTSADQYNGNSAKPDQLDDILRRGGPTEMRAESTALYRVGDTVCVKMFNPKSHTRAPRYIRGRCGVIANHYGAHVFPDENAKSAKRVPAHLYCVQFTGMEVWGQGAEPGTSIFVDLFEPYLVR